MKRSLNTLLGLGLMAATVAGASPANAVVMASGGGWVPRIPGDTDWISHSGGYAFNTDAATSHWASTSIPRDAGFGGVTTFTFALKGNGQNFTCWVYALDTSTGSVTSNNASTSVNAFTNLAVTIIPPNGGVYAWTGQCNIPKQLPSNFARVYAVW